MHAHNTPINACTHTIPIHKHNAKTHNAKTHNKYA